MFREAEQQDAVLLLDEADSFLQDRQGAQRSWEVTQVNELLVQMETFQGIFICATNLMERLDPAVLRRFDVKLKLEYLKPGQAERLFRQVLSGAGQPDEAVLKGLRALTNLTPGDFATVTRLARVIGLLITPEWLLAALTEECRAKPGANRAIGFVV
jgi:SpoVK/Ycf46/Vps4 family AAA+-type ATPase